MENKIGTPKRYPLTPPSSMLSTVVMQLHAKPEKSKPMHHYNETAPTLNLGGARGKHLCCAVPILFSIYGLRLHLVSLRRRGNGHCIEGGGAALFAVRAQLRPQHASALRR